MSRYFRITLAVVIGLIVGSVVNTALIMVGGKVILPPANADVTTMEGLKASLHLFEARHYVFPFLAHALGTLVGALVACKLAPKLSPVPAYIVGGFFMLGGIANAVMLPAPIWFITLDLLAAYFPAAWLGYALVKRFFGGSQPAH